MNEIYKMKLHDEIIILNAYSVLRVPGGWIYTTIRGNEYNSPVFVKFDNEFQVD